MNDVVPRKELVKQAGKGIGGIAGGAVLLVLRGIASIGAGFSIPGLVVGGALALVGFAISRSKEDRLAGMIGLAAGIATVAASIPIASAIGAPLLLVSGIGLLAAGGWSLFKFLKNLKAKT